MATEDNYLSIGEVAQLTGVNPVTLRAWQRRFGLVIPHRTPKGHRLYSPQQLAQIREILSWLEKGVTISRIKPLLTGEASITSASDEHGQQLLDGLSAALIQLRPVTLLQRLDEISSLYPQPVLGQLLASWLGQLTQQLAARVDGEWLKAWLQPLLQQWLAARQGRLVNRKPKLVTVLSLGPQPQWSEWLLTLALVESGIYPQWLTAAGRLSSLGLLSGRLQGDALLLLPGPDGAALLDELTPLATQWQMPLLVTGELAGLLPSVPAGVILAPSQQQLLAALLAIGAPQP